MRVASTARIITGAALIIIAVFVGFAAGDQVEFQQMGFGVAVSLLIDATLVRLVLLPAVLTLLGERTWYLPRWLGWMPHLEIEGGGHSATLRSEPEQEAQHALDPGKRGCRRDPEPGDEAVHRHGLDVLTRCVADLVQACARIVELDVRGQIALCRRDRNDDREPRRTLVHRVVGDDDRGAIAGLLGSDRLSEVDEPELAASRRHRPSRRARDSSVRSASIARQPTASSRSSA